MSFILNIESDHSEDEIVVQDDNSILEKFLTKHSPKKLDIPDTQGNTTKSKIDENLIDNSSQVEYNIDSKAPNISQEEVSEGEIKQQEIDEILNESGPKRWDIPLKDICVCSSGFDQETKLKIQNHVEKLGGRYSYDFTEEVTVLISRGNKSEKYIMAREESKIYTVSPKWLRESTEKGYFLNPEDYTFPIFFNRIFNFHN